MFSIEVLNLLLQIPRDHLDDLEVLQ